jgi:hypothetical protein
MGLEERTQMVTGARPKVAASTRPVPERRPEFAHLSLDGLRAYRRALSAEEGRVSYWRRLIQARLDVVADVDAVHDPNSHERIRAVFAESRSAGRQALVSVVPVDVIPPIPDLESLWSRELRPDDLKHTALLRRELSHAELQLSAYRAALHRKLAAGTQELIARYREEPSLALTALPLVRPQGR